MKNRGEGRDLKRKYDFGEKAAPDSFEDRELEGGEGGVVFLRGIRDGRLRAEDREGKERGSSIVSLSTRGGGIESTRPGEGEGKWGLSIMSCAEERMRTFRKPSWDERPKSLPRFRKNDLEGEGKGNPVFHPKREEEGTRWSEGVPLWGEISSVGKRSTTTTEKKEGGKDQRLFCKRRVFTHLIQLRRRWKPGAGGKKKNRSFSMQRRDGGRLWGGKQHHAGRKGPPLLLIAASKGDRESALLVDEPFLEGGKEV